MAEMWSRRQQEPDDTMQRILEALEKRGPSAETTFLARDNDAMRQEIAALKSQVGELTKKRDETIKQFETLKRGMEKMAKMIPPATDLTSVMGQFEEVKKYMGDFTSAVGKIKLPEFPEIPKPPEYKETNLEPLTALVQSIQEQLAEKKEESNVVELKPQPEEWTFDVKRNQGGFIKTIKATRG